MSDSGNIPTYAELAKTCRCFIPGGGSGGRWCSRCRRNPTEHLLERVETYHPAGPFLTGPREVVPVRPRVPVKVKHFHQDGDGQWTYGEINAESVL